MKDADSRTSELMHVPSAVLMERAALLTAGRVIKRLKSEGERVLIVCGPGNNGGDGFACARILLEKNIDTEVLYIGKEEKMSPLEKEQYLSVKALKEDCIYMGSLPVIDHDIIVDAIFGISLSRNVEGEYADMIEKINDRKKRNAYIISIDIPSGIDADTAFPMGTAVIADETVCCGFLKPGNVLFPGAFYNGELFIADIGITERSLKSKPRFSVFEDREIRLPDRKSDSNKGTYGKVLIVAGNRDIAGAAVLSASAALRTGCGMVRVLTHENNRVILQTACPEVLVSTYREESLTSGTPGQTSLFDTSEKSLPDIVKEAIAWSSVIAIGPGIGTDGFSEKLLKLTLQNAGSRPVVLDADALNIISRNTEIMTDCTSDMVITPHLMEMSRLTGVTVPEIKSHIIDVAADFASGYHVTVVLKDSRTVTACRSGEIVINMKGGNGMATAGSGDVLTGMIASLIAQGEEVEKASCLGVSLHGLAGERAAGKYGEHAMTARDIIEGIR